MASELADLGIRSPAGILACYLAGGAELEAWLAAIPPHVDGVPAVEYESGMLLDRDAPWLATFGELVALRPAEPPAELMGGLPEAESARARGVAAARAPWKRSSNGCARASPVVLR